MREDYFKDIYKDFFNIESLPKIEVKEDTEKLDSSTKMQELFNKINELPITEESRNLLKKIIEYMRKYQEKIENNYIPFRLILNVSNNKLTEDITDILYQAGVYFNYIENKKSIISCYKIDKDYDYQEGLVLINDLLGFGIQDDKLKKLFLHNLNKHLVENRKIITILSGTNQELDNFFLGEEQIKTYFNFTITYKNPDNQDIYNDIINNVSLDDDKKIKLLNYITETYKNNTDYYTYKNELINYISFNKDIPILKEEKSIDEVFASLNELVGLDKVKRVLHELVDVISLKEKAGDNLKINNLNLHMVFLGNPGTGKTTIARMISEILYNLKYIKENKLVEVSVKDLVGEYVGQTAPKTMAVIEKSLNGVLFIDEAYTLAVSDGNSYNAEAIATLIQAMENYRNELVVIFAGYTKEMQAFLNSNSGISSRIGYVLEFDDYTTDELIKIFLGMTNKAGFIVEDEAITYLKEIIDKYRNMDNFGNARFIRNIFEKTVIKHATNVKDKKQNKILKTITKNDINIDNLILK